VTTTDWPGAKFCGGIQAESQTTRINASIFKRLMFTVILGGVRLATGDL
jgi:hypothetical protein